MQRSASASATTTATANATTGHRVVPARARIAAELGLVLAISLAVRALFLLVMPESALSLDVRGWKSVALELAEGRNPYATTTRLNWPPLWMLCIDAMSRTARLLEVDFARVLQAFLVSVDLAVAALAYGILRSLAVVDATKIVIFGISLNPILILLNCQHCNFDILVGGLVLAFVAALVCHARQRTATRDATPWLLACFLLGLAVLAKTVPIVLAPLLAIGLDRVSWGKRIFGATLVCFPVLLGLGVVFVLAPNAVIDNVLAYRSAPGSFGWTAILQWLELDSVLAAYSRAFPFALLAMLALVARHVRRHSRQLDGSAIAMLAVILLIAVPTFGPGYGSQYVCWYLPTLVIVAGVTQQMRRPLAILLGIASLVYIFEYALFPAQGAFLLWMTSFAEPIRSWSQAFASPSAQAIARLPFFAASLALIWLLARRVSVSARNGPGR